LLKRYLAAMAIAAASLTILPAPAKAATSGGGYWMLTSDGHVYGFGAAEDLGSPAQIPGRVHIARTKTGAGYWILSSAGTVYPFGDAASYGSGPARGGGEQYTTMAATPTGMGYWLFTN